MSDRDRDKDSLRRRTVTMTQSSWKKRTSILNSGRHRHSLSEPTTPGRGVALGKTSPPRPPLTRQFSAAFYPFSREGLALASEKLASLRPFRNEDFDIDCDKDLKIIRKIAQGAFGVVHEAELRRGGEARGRRCAVKVQPVDAHAQSAAGLLAELTVLKELAGGDGEGDEGEESGASRRLVRFLGAGHKAGAGVHFVFELCEHGALRECLAQGLGWPLKVRLCLDAARGLEFLHGRGVLHRDVKTPNVVVDGAWRAKLCDFNFCVDADSPDRYGFLCGTKEFLAPEVSLYDYEPSTEFGLPADCYALGVTFAEVVTELKPGAPALDLTGTYADDFRADLDQVGAKAVAGAPGSLVTLVGFLLARDPEERTAADQAREWLEDLLPELGEVALPSAARPARAAPANLREAAAREGGVRQSLMTPRGVVEVLGEGLGAGPRFPTIEEERCLYGADAPLLMPPAPAAAARGGGAAAAAWGGVDAGLMQEGLEELSERLAAVEGALGGEARRRGRGAAAAGGPTGGGEGDDPRDILIKQLHEEVTSLHDENSWLRQQLQQSQELTSACQVTLEGNRNTILLMQEDIALNRKALQEGVDSVGKLPDASVANFSPAKNSSMGGKQQRGDGEQQEGCTIC